MSAEDRLDPLDWQLLFEASPEVLLVLLPDSPRFTMVAATAARLAVTHLTREQTVGHGLFEVFPDNPDDGAATGAGNLRASLERVIATRAPDTMAVQKYDIRGPDGTFQVRWWSPRNLPVLGPRGELRYILHRVEDVTDLLRAGEAGEQLRDRNREMEREVVRRSHELASAIADLRAANARLGELDAAKTVFFGNISHELRTPLTLMLGPLEDALGDAREALGPAQDARVRVAHANAVRLLKLVNALLDFARLEAGRLRASFAPIDLAQLTAELAGMFSSAMERGGIELVVECPPLASPAYVDRDMWEKIVTNLIGNAFKFTHHGAVRVRLREDDARFVLEVEDTGVGIPASELGRIFERFHRVAASEGRTHEGAGIGLSLVRELAALRGGDASVESERGRGTTFRVTIPRGHAHLPPDAVSQRRESDLPIGRDARAHADEARGLTRASVIAPAAARRGAHVLVVDDNADLRGYLAALLAPTYEVSVACDGVEALERVRARRPDLVLSDVMMPRLDGFGLVRALRGEPTSARIPVILLSARAGEEASVEGLDAGADDYLVKPFSTRELLARVRAHVELARTRSSWEAELERSNRELEAFSYSVSHDLRAPLRAIDGFAQAIEEDCAAMLDETGRAHLARVRAGARRMDVLIDAFLELARVSRIPLERRRVDLGAIATAIVGDLRRVSPERVVDVEIGQDLVAAADRGLVLIVLTNLLANAWKFTSKRERARIEVGRLDLEEPTFFVRDDGAGFDITTAERLFTPFRRYHVASEFPGTGVGLATVARVVARHGGRAWADAAVDRGATFFFTLPDA